MKKPRTIKDLHNDPRVADLWSEFDGCWGEKKAWWCFLEAGWQDVTNPTSRTLHEQTIAEICDFVHSAIPYPNDPELNQKSESVKQ